MTLGCRLYLVAAVMCICSVISVAQITGEPGIYNGSTFVTDGLFVDATQFPGAPDICLQIKNASTSTGCTSSSGPPASNPKGCYVKAPFQGVQYCGSNPFASWKAGGFLDLRGATTLDIRTDVSWYVPEGVHIIGGGSSSSYTASALFLYANTIIRANNPNFMYGGSGTGLPLPAFNAPSESISTISVSGTTAKITTATNHSMCSVSSFDNGQDVFVYGGPSGTIFFAYHGLAFGGTGNGGCSAGQGQYFYVQVPSGTSGCSSMCNTMTVYEGQPLVSMSNNTNTDAQYRTQIEGISLDCAWVLGCIPLINAGAEEDSWFRNVNFLNSGGEGARITQISTALPMGGTIGGGGANNSGPYSDFSVNFDTETCELSAGCYSGAVGYGGKVYQTSGVSSLVPNPLTCETLGILIDGPSGTATKTLNVTKGVSAFTVSASDPSNSGHDPASMNSTTCGKPYDTVHGPFGGYSVSPMGVLTYGSNVDISDYHTEYFLAPAEVGGNTALNVAFPGLNSQGAQSITSGVFLHNQASCCSGASSAFAVDIGNANANTGGISLTAIVHDTSNLVDDNISGQTCVDSSQALGNYLLGDGTPPFVASSCPGVNFAAACTSNCMFVVGAPGLAVGTVYGGGIAPGNISNYTQWYGFYNDMTRELGKTCLGGVLTPASGQHFHAGVYSVAGTTLTLQWDCGQWSTATAGQVSSTGIPPFTMTPGTYYIAFCSDTTSTFVPYGLAVSPASSNLASTFLGGSALANGFGVDGTDLCTSSAASLPSTATTTNISFSPGSTVVDIPYLVSVNH